MTDPWRYAVYPIHGQGEGYGASEVPKIALFYVYLLRHLQGIWQTTIDS